MTPRSPVPRRPQALRVVHDAATDVVYCSLGSTVPALIRADPAWPGVEWRYDTQLERLIGVTVRTYHTVDPGALATRIQDRFRDERGLAVTVALPR